MTCISISRDIAGWDMTGSHIPGRLTRMELTVHGTGTIRHSDTAPTTSLEVSITIMFPIIMMKILARDTGPQVMEHWEKRSGCGHWPGTEVIWENLLTDTHGQYVEVQAGRMFNQNSFNSARTPFKQSSFIPYNSDSWVERWFPIRETDGATRVAESGTIHITYSPEGMELLFSPIIEVSEALRSSCQWR